MTGPISNHISTCGWSALPQRCHPCTGGVSTWLESCESFPETRWPGRSKVPPVPSGPSGVDVPRDEGLHHFVRPIGLRTGLCDPLMHAALEDGVVTQAPCCAVGLDEPGLGGGPHVGIQRSLHDEQRL